MANDFMKEGLCKCMVIRKKELNDRRSASKKSNFVS